MMIVSTIKVEAFASVIFSKDEPHLSPELMPLLSLPYDLWIRSDLNLVDYALRRFDGTMVGLNSIGGLLDFQFLLVLHPLLALRQCLKPLKGPRPLDLVDAEGKIAVAFRNWRVRSVGNDYAEGVPRLKGCHLLIRPDIFELIASQADAQPFEVLRVIRSNTEREGV
jgi:hypothetical protein